MMRLALVGLAKCVMNGNPDGARGSARCRDSGVGSGNLMRRWSLGMFTRRLGLQWLSTLCPRAIGVCTRRRARAVIGRQRRG